MTTQPGTDGTPDEGVAVRRLQWILGARLGVASLLLGATLYFAIDALHSGGFTPTVLLGLISTIYGSSILFGVWLLRRRQIKMVAATMVALDTLLITVLVYLTGGAGSIFSILYGAQILTAAMTIGSNAAYWTAAASLSLYVSLAFGFSTGWLAPPPDQPLDQYMLNTPDLSFALLSNVVGVGSVALLASSLARRLQRTGGRLVKAEESAAQLARLNDDIVRSIASGVITADQDSIISTMNPAARDILRDQSARLIGQPLSKVLLGHNPKNAAEPPRRADGMGHRADGSPFPIGYTLSTLVDARGNASGLLLAFQDLTEIKDLRDKAQQAERLAVLGQLATGLAHEIRNPLGAISGSVQLVKTNVVQQEDRQLLSIVSSEVDRLNELVTTMLQVGRPPQLEPETRDLRDLVTNVVQVARTDASLGPRIQIEAVIHDDPVTATIDADRMRQVLWNLVKNAVQASPKGGTIEVEAGLTARGLPYLQVSDQGEGISEEHREHLFDMFYSGRVHGVGLGLALVKQIVDRHRATIHVRSRKPSGTSFRIELPRPDDGLAPTPPKASGPTSHQDSPGA